MFINGVPHKTRLNKLKLSHTVSLFSSRVRKNNEPKQNRVYIFVFVWVPSIHWHIVVCCMSLWSCIRGGQNGMIPLVETDGGFWAFSFIPYHLHFKEGQLQHTTNILFLAARPRKWMFIVIGPVLSLDPMGMGWAKMRNVDLISCFPFLIAV